MRRIVRASLVLVVAVLILFLGVAVIHQKRQHDLGEWDFQSIEAYQQAREAPDAELFRLRYEIRKLEASVQGSVVLMFDQCSENVYDMVYAQLTEYNMTGSVVFRESLPGDADVITEEQWRQMQQSGWSAVLGASEELLSTLGQPGYEDRLCSHVEQLKRRFDEQGFREPIAYSFSAGEYSDQLLEMLIDRGFVIFSSPDAKTGICGENKNAAIIKEFYICSDPKAPLLQKKVEAIKNTADMLVIKTRYVEVIEDITKDITLLKFRYGMLRSMSIYQAIGSLRIESVESAFQNYKMELVKLESVKQQRDVLLLQVEDQKKELERIWLLYRLRYCVEN